MTEIEEIGEGLVDSVAEMFSVEESLRRIPRGLEWGRKGARQRLWWENPQHGSEGSPDLIRMRILTEVVGLPQDAAKWPDGMISEVLGVTAQCLWGGLMFADEMDGSLCFGAAVTAHEGTAGFLAMQLFRAMAAQAAVRELLFSSGIGQNFSEFPGGDTGGDMAELGQAIHYLFEQGGDDRPEEIDDDLSFLTSNLQGFPCVMCNCDEGNLVADLPFGETTSQVRIDTMSEHDIFGPAISIVLLLPIEVEELEQITRQVLEMNRVEQPILSVPWCVGSWSITGEDTFYLTYVLWLPFSMFSRNMLINLGAGMIARAEFWCKQMTGQSFEQAYPKAQKGMMDRLQRFLENSERTDEG
jgi:hypothetical protein